MEFVPLLAMGLLVFQIINFVRFCFGGDINGIVTTASVWFAGVVVVFLVAQTDYAHEIHIGTSSLAVLNSWSLLFIGLTISSIANFGNETLAAVDKFRTTAKPHLVEEEEGK